MKYETELFDLLYFFYYNIDMNIAQQRVETLRLYLGINKCWSKK